MDHPKALDFLREDIKHINDYFSRGGVAVLSNREVFDFVTDANITDDNEEASWEALQQIAARYGCDICPECKSHSMNAVHNVVGWVWPHYLEMTVCTLYVGDGRIPLCNSHRVGQGALAGSKALSTPQAHCVTILLLMLSMLCSRPAERAAQDEVDEAVFHQAFIPRRLEEVTNYERDRDILAAGGTRDGIYYQTITGGGWLSPAVCQHQYVNWLVSCCKGLQNDVSGHSGALYQHDCCTYKKHKLPDNCTLGVCILQM